MISTSDEDIDYKRDSFSDTYDSLILYKDYRGSLKILGKQNFEER